MLVWHTIIFARSAILCWFGVSRHGMIAAADSLHQESASPCFNCRIHLNPRSPVSDLLFNKMAVEKQNDLQSNGTVFDKWRLFCSVCSDSTGTGACFPQLLLGF